VAKFKEDIVAGLSNLSKIADNTSYAYIKLTLAEKELELLFEPITQYKHIIYLDLSQNQLSDVTLLAELPHLASLNLSKNQLTSFRTLLR